jgi:aquaporin NIP
MNYRKYFAEFIGTFILVFCCTGAGASNEVNNGVLTLLGISITCGLVVLALIYALGDTSGAHLNPAVTIAFAVAKRFSWAQVTPYVVAQFLGGLLASFVIRLLFPSSEFLGSTLPGGSQMQSFVFEIILAFILMLVVMGVSTGSKEKGITAGIAIGAVVCFEIIMAGPVCGASMNPARSLAPALFSGHTEHLWIYMSAPVIGMILSVGVYRVMRGEGEV